MLHYKPYAGIGSRETPPDILKRMKDLAQELAAAGFTLRSGGAEGADSAFEEGAGTRKEVFLPWKGFNKSISQLWPPSEKAIALAKTIHPNWAGLSQGAQKLHARNTQQILGKNLDQPAAMVIYWARVFQGVPQGGTATGVSLAIRHHIKTFNLNTPNLDDILKEIREFSTKI